MERKKYGRCHYVETDLDSSGVAALPNRVIESGDMTSPIQFASCRPGYNKKYYLYCW